MTINILKTTLTGVAVGGVSLVFPLVTFAQSVSPSTPVTKGNQTDRLATLHNRCDTETANRIASLTTVSGKVTGMKKLTDAQKSQFTNNIQSLISQLNTQKAKCDADTDLATLKADTLAVFSSFRVYAVVIPQVHLLAATDRLGTTTDQLNTIVTKLQDRIQTAGNPGTLTTLLTDMKSKLSDAQTQYNNAASLVSNITASSFNNDKSGTTTTLQTARTDLKTAISDLKTAFSDAKQIRQGLKGTKAASITPVTSPTVMPSM